MKKTLVIAKSILLLAVLLLSIPVFAQLPAFPGAEGFGKYATGGRFGSVYHVTNLNNSGSGSLRDAVSTPNRIVVFDVAGVIRITERMIVSSNIYIAGQTAPGEGITVYGNGWSFSNAHNTICRYIKIRMGIVGSSGVDANGLASGHDIIFDHCSVSWGRDENFSINSTTAQNITIQNSIMSQGLLTHSAGGLMQCDGGITLYRNLYADNGTRNNKVKGVSQYVNNIVYNWSAGAYIMGGESSGKTTLAAALAQHLDTRWVPEFGREWWLEREGSLQFEDMLHIARTQVAREDTLRCQARRWLLCDTTPLTTLFYSLDTFGKADPELVQLARRTYHAVLLCAPDFAFVQDGTRRQPSLRQRQHDWYLRMLDEQQIAYTVIAGPLQERVLQAAATLSQNSS